MTPESLRAAGDIKAAIVTHLYGRFADVKGLNACGIPLIEDCAQGHGLGSVGNLACFSFYPTKNLGALGDGGGVVTNDAAIASRLRSLRQYGWTSKYRSEVPGGRNSRMDELQAAILRVKLPHLRAWNQRRREIAARYDEAFGISAATDVAHLYVIRSTKRSQLRTALADRGIATEIHYPIPDHRQTSIVAGNVHLPVTEQLCEEVLTLPLFPEMTADEVEGVIRAVLETGETQGESLFV
jgi:dTDP-3-amino-2,3,6-trideoxy-4-keto-D-glucose/dTDP-3-amino-3,4,6-trideoxy-alpha-D-glucose/dTDP-2,6-dideoxy-D-kanosamine transaminase